MSNDEKFRWEIAESVRLDWAMLAYSGLVPRGGAQIVRQTMLRHHTPYDRYLSRKFITVVVV
jgi:hypothetical protein